MANQKKYANFDASITMRHVEHEIDKILDRYLEGVLTTDEVRVLHRQLDDDLPSGDVQAVLDRIELPADLLEQPTVSVQTKAYQRRPAYRLATPPSVARLRLSAMYGTLTLLLFIIPCVLYMFCYVWPLRQQQKMVEQYFTPYNAASYPINIEDATIATTWQTAVFKYNNAAQYNAADYLTAAHTFETLLAQPFEDIYALHFYIGVSYIAAHQPSNALAHLAQVSTAVTPLRQQALWYMALAYLQNNNRVSAKNVLQQIVSTPNAYRQQEAKSLLAKLG